MILDIYINGELFAMTEEKDYGRVSEMLPRCRDKFITSPFMPGLVPYDLVSVIPGGSIYMGQGSFERLPPRFELQNIKLAKKCGARVIKL